jgi:hypothetical protein
MSKIEYHFRIGDAVYSVSLEAETREDGTSVISADDLLREQWHLGKKLVLENHDADTVSCELFNFLVDISGMTNAEIASFIGIEPATISQWRRNKGISKAAWQMFRVFFYDLFSNGSVTHPILIGNRQRMAG